MTLPVLLSVPHAGLRVPPEVAHLNLLEPSAIIADGDEGAAEIYDLESHVAAVVTTDIARAYLDLNRAEDDRRKDGVVKTHTCWDIPIYRKPLSEDVVVQLLEKYYRPYHDRLRRLSAGLKLCIDCHTMAEKGPPVGPDPGEERPLVCLSNADGTCPEEWIKELADLFARAFARQVSINHPFRGGYIIRSHSSEIPWVQLEFARTPKVTNQQKRNVVLEVLRTWCR